MTAYSLRKPFTLEDARALIGMNADITFETDADEGTTETRTGIQVFAAYQRPGRGYIEIGPGVLYVPFGDVREVASVRTPHPGNLVT